MKYVSLILLFIGLSLSGRTQVLPQYPMVPLLDSSAKVYLLTCDPGPEIWSVFGHAGLRIQDTTNGIDWVYNYGTFAFSDDFLWKFLKGDLNYRISREQFPSFLQEYESYPRGVIAQELNLNVPEKQKLLRLLETNYLPENRYYQYDFLFDNCSSRLRDILDSATSGNIQYDFRFIQSRKSYRELIRGHAGHMKWLMLGMDFLIGSRTDLRAQERDYFFLPDYLMEGYFFAGINHGSKTEPFVNKSFLVVDAPRFKQNLTLFQSPIFIFSCLAILVLIISIIEIFRKKWFLWIDVFLCFVLGSAGLIVFLLSTLTRHHTTYDNLNLLWANPIYLLCVPFILVAKSRWKYYVFTFLMIWSVLVVVFIPLLPQSINIAFIPIMMMSIVRFFVIRNQSKNVYLSKVKNKN